tara:strand:+ start:206 stop:1282 length:1077 start_codon:yes stop_codon:yes gene_type:complete
MFVILFFLGLSILPVLLILLFPLRKVVINELPQQRKVVICVAARNEEKYIARCLDALLNLNFPSNDYRICVADDGSTDSTLSIVQKYVEMHFQISVLKVNQEDTRTKGKARALAQITDDLSCDYLAFTDADVEVSKDWLRSMLGAIGSSGMISGTTLIKQKSCFAKWQCMDWLMSQLQVQLSMFFIKKCPTAMGNNMLVRTSSYNAVGGYGDLPFSITEDVSLHSVFKKHGFVTEILFGLQFVVFTKSEINWKELMMQRLRWCNSLAVLPKLIISFLALQSLFLPLLIATGFMDMWYCSFLLLVKLMLNIIVLKSRNPVKANWTFFHVLSFEFYQWRLGGELIFSLISSRIITWKGRL